MHTRTRNKPGPDVLILPSFGYPKAFQKKLRETLQADQVESFLKEDLRYDLFISPSDSQFSGTAFEE